MRSPTRPFLTALVVQDLRRRAQDCLAAEDDPSIGHTWVPVNAHDLLNLCDCWSRLHPCAAAQSPQPTPRITLPPSDPHAEEPDSSAP